MDEGREFNQMARYTKDTGKTGNKMARDDSFTLKVICTKAIGLITNYMVKERM